ncbi:MAG: redoxin domain-containing protein [Cyclobacteriaceae bacterium]|nr:redoxin domain-containing protein [Cyclobacteriaceae bacterium]
MIPLVVACFIGYAQQVVPNFQLPDVVSGQTVSLAQQAGKPVVVIFTSNDCPYDNYYSTRIATLVGQYGDRVVFLFINSHLDPQESEESMKKQASGWGFNPRYLSDKSQVAMEALGARRSPEVFLLKPANGQFSVFYSGAIDDNPQEAAAVTSPYLRDALENMLSGKPAMTPVRAAGCSIRRK